MTLPSQPHDELVSTYSPPSEELTGERRVAEFARAIRRQVIDAGGQGDCIGVTKAMSAVLEDLGVAHNRVSRHEGRYLEKKDPVPHAWIRIQSGELPLYGGDIIVDPTAEQFVDARSDVHVASAQDEFVRNHYRSGALPL